MKTRVEHRNLRSGWKKLSSLTGCAALAIAFAIASQANRAAAQTPAPAVQTTAPELQAAPPAADSPAPSSPTAIAGIWQGTLTPPNGGNGQRIVIKVTKDAAGTYHASMYNADRGTSPLTFNSVTIQGTDIKFTTPMLTIEGTLSADGKTIDAKWGMGGPNPLAISLARTAPDGAWAIPEAPKQMPPDAKPVFDVVTVKPSPPGRGGKNIGFDGHHFLLRNANLNDMIALGFGLHAKQIAGAPDWAGKDLFDVEGTPDVPGIPNPKQMQNLMQNLLADRFQLKFHNEKRELAVYAITVAAGGPKLTKSTAAPSDPGGFGIQGPNAQGVTVIGRNLTIAGFATWFQASVTDRPVVDQTGLTDRYDMRLKWTPDESQFEQFRGTGMSIPAPSDAADAPPNLYTAIQEQLGLKIEATKAPDDVMVIDNVEKPGAN
jgi:uncharacterized protein (TIGR03435 family)